MEKLDPEFKAKWLEALRSGKYAQGKASLCRLIDRETGDKEYCCIGVGYRVAKGIDPYDTSTGYLERDHEKLDLNGVPEILIGSGAVNPVTLQLSNMNDDGESFATIADYIEENL